MKTINKKTPLKKIQLTLEQGLNCMGPLIRGVFFFFFIKYVVLQDHRLLAEPTGVEPWVPRAHYKVTP